MWCAPLGLQSRSNVPTVCLGGVPGFALRCAVCPGMCLECAEECAEKCA